MNSSAPPRYNDQTIVIDGFSKSHSMTGLRFGYVHGPQAMMQQMIKLQQFTFVCAPHPVQWAGLAAWDDDISDRVAEYKAKRDFIRLGAIRRFYNSRRRRRVLSVSRSPLGHRHGVRHRSHQE